MERFRQYAAPVVASILFAMGAIAWHYTYAVPREAFLHDVMECMTEREGDAVERPEGYVPDFEADYAACVEQVKASRR